MRTDELDQDSSNSQADENTGDFETKDAVSDSGAKPKKGRNTAGLVAAAKKRREANAEKKASQARDKEKADREQYAAQYQSLKTQIGAGSAQTYSMKSLYAVANAIQHPTFGLGFVTVATTERIEVAFESGVRQLIHNRK